MYNTVGGFIRNIDTNLEHISVPVYYVAIAVLYIIYFMSMLGIAYVDPQYTDYLNTGIQIFIAVVLLIRFNPFRKIQCTSNDAILITASAVFMLINDGVAGWLHTYFKKAQYITQFN